MKLTASQDRDAIGAWIEGQADRQEGKRILGDLPRLRRGEGYPLGPWARHSRSSRISADAHTIWCFAHSGKSLFFIN
jgi:hypothetical protein